MEAVLIPEQDSAQFVEQQLGFPSASLEDIIAELLRSELAARRISGRRSLCDRIIILLESAGIVSRDQVKDVLFSLEKAGDISGGPKGRIAAAPLRAVKLAEKKYQLFGSIPHGQIAMLLHESKLTVGATRILTLKGDDRHEWNHILSELGGIELSPERWAGLDKVGAADQNWLDGLNNRLLMESVSAGSFDQETRDEWKVYQPDKAKLLQKARWHKDNQGEQGNLWRIWHERGWPIYCWTAGDSPERVEQIRLSADEANRTMFALDRLNEASISCKITKKKKKTQIQIGGFLPNAEYRYLITKGKFIGKYGDYFCFQLNNAIWQEVSELMIERLGILG